MARSWQQILKEVLDDYVPIDLDQEEEQVLFDGLSKKIAGMRSPNGVKVIHIIDWRHDWAYGTDECTGTYPVYENDCPAGGEHEAQIINGQEVCCKCGGIYQTQKIKRRRFDADYKEILDAEEDRV